MSSETFELNCPFCDKLYKLPREKVIKHAGKMIHCRKCGQPFSIPALPSEEEVAEPDIDLIPVAAVAEEQAPEPAVAQPPDEESAPPVALAASETIEPPAVSHDEVKAPAANISERDAEAIASVGLSEEPPSYFASPEISGETVELSGEPAFSMEPVEPVNEIPFVESQDPEEPMGVTDPDELHPLQAIEDGASDEHEELPPPPLPPVKVVRNERVSVKPVFDAVEEEEPVPRRRRFGKRAEADGPVAATPAPMVEPVEVAQEKPVELEAAVVEVGQEAPETLSEPVAQEEAAAIAEPEQAPVKEDAPILARTHAEPAAISDNVLGILVTIRRAVVLLAVMSVVIAVVLIAVLLAIMGIIPKR